MSAFMWFRLHLPHVLIMALFWLLVACGELDSSSDSSGATGTALQVSWSPNPESVSGYIVYYGPTEDTATTVASDLPVTSGSFNPNAPSVTYNAGLDLSLSQGSQVCFRIRAYNDNGLSGWSKAACGSI